MTAGRLRLKRNSLSHIANATGATTELIDENGDWTGGVTAPAGSIGTTELANDGVTYAKIQNVTATNRLLGRSTAGAGDVEEITVGGDLTQSGSTFTIANDAVNEAKTADSVGLGGLYIKKYALAVYDFAVDGGAQAAITLAGNANIPDNAIVKAVEYDVLTTCTSASDAATIKLNLPTDGDLTTAIAISNGSNPWDAGAHSPNLPIPVKTTGVRQLQITIGGGENITAGKIVFAVEYYVSQ